MDKIFAVFAFAFAVSLMAGQSHAQGRGKWEVIGKDPGPGSICDNPQTQGCNRGSNGGNNGGNNGGGNGGGNSGGNWTLVCWPGSMCTPWYNPPK